MAEILALAAAHASSGAAAATAWVATHPVAAAVALWALLYVKGLPGVWHVRFAWAVLAEFAYPTPLESVTDRVVWRDRVSLDSLDFNFHMNNASYAVLADFVRAAWFVRIFRTFSVRGLHAAEGRHQVLRGGSVHKGTARNANDAACTLHPPAPRTRRLQAYRAMRPANGGVAHLFLRELTWLEPLAVSAQLIGVDAKWFYVRLEHTSRRTNRLHAVGLTRICFKAASGRTIAPRDALRQLGWAVPPALVADAVVGELLGRLSDELLDGVEGCPPPRTPAAPREAKT